MHKATRERLEPQPAELTVAIVARLAAESVHNLEQWRSLGRRRTQIFGVPARAIAALDRMARAERRRHQQLRTLSELLAR